MSEELKQGIDGTSPAREIAGNQLFDLVVKCYRDVYRRAGIPFTRGENRVVGASSIRVQVARTRGPATASPP